MEGKLSDPKGILYVISSIRERKDPQYFTE